MIATAFIGGIGCVVMHPGRGRLLGIVGPTLAIVSMQTFGSALDTWDYTLMNLAAAVTGGAAYGYGRMAKLRAIADAD